MKSTQPTLFEEARRWLGSRTADQADAVSEDHERGQRVTADPGGWEHLRTVVRVEMETFDAKGTRLRRVAYTILTLLRSVTQRSEERRHVPWKALLDDVFFALVSATDAELPPRSSLAEGPD